MCYLSNLPFLADFGCSNHFEDVYPSCDLESLALVLIECMNGKPLANAADRNSQLYDIRAERANNRVFGIQRAEEWSGCDQLVDFLDDLLNMEKSSKAKIERPVSSSKSMFVTGLLTREARVRF